MSALVYFSFTLTTILYSCDAYKALVVYPMPARSHGNLGDALVKQLLKDGNEVTYMTAFEYKNPPSNLHQIDISSNAVILRKRSLDIKRLLDKNVTVNDHDNIKRFIISIITNTLEIEEVQNLLSDQNVHFDVVIVEWMFSEILSGYYDEMESEEYNKRIAPYIIMRGRQPPPFDEVKYNASLVVGNSHAGMGEATRLPQNYKHIGGYHIDEDVKPLPEDLKKIMETAKNGVIYFSMGSNLKSNDWPDSIKLGLLKVFGELKQTVLWKFEEDFPNVPKNVHIIKWAPQPSILSHKNCILFISHGGLLSITETIHFGVPIIGIPVYGDQFMNVRKAVNKGFAVKVDLTYNLAIDLKVAIAEILSNPTYKSKVKEVSFIYHDRPVKPAQELGHWVRHVVETRGAVHLRSPILCVPFYQRLYLDLLAIILVVFILILNFLRSLYTIICTKKKLVNTKKRN